MAPKAPPKPSGPKTPLQQFNDYLDSPDGQNATKGLAFLFFLLAVLMSTLYYLQLKKGWELIEALKSIRQFMIAYDPSLESGTDREALAAAHLLSLKMLNWTLKNEALQKELKTLTSILPEWHAFEKNLYYFSNERKTWHQSRADCLARHTADLVTCKRGEEQGFVDKYANKQKKDFWLGLFKDKAHKDRLTWIDKDVPKHVYWSPGQPQVKNEPCIVLIPPCTIRHCWHDAPCEELRFFCCEMQPESKWFH